MNEEEEQYAHARFLRAAPNLISLTKSLFLWVITRVGENVAVVYLLRITVSPSLFIHEVHFRFELFANAKQFLDIYEYIYRF